MVCKHKNIKYQYIWNNLDVSNKQFIVNTLFHVSQGPHSFHPCQDPKFHELILAFDPTMQDGCVWWVMALFKNLFTIQTKIIFTLDVSICSANMPGVHSGN